MTSSFCMQFPHTLPVVCCLQHPWTPQVTLFLGPSKIKRSKNIEPEHNEVVLWLCVVTHLVTMLKYSQSLFLAHRGVVADFLKLLKYSLNISVHHYLITLPPNWGTHRHQCPKRKTRPKHDPYNFLYYKGEKESKTFSRPLHFPSGFVAGGLCSNTAS